MLKIIKSNQPIPVKNITVTIYKLPGIGGTSLAFSAGKVLLFDTDDGAYRSGNRGDTVRPSKWEEISNLTAEDLAPYDVICLDTVGRALDMLTAHLLDSDPKLGRKSGDLSLQGFGALKSAFITWLKRMRSFEKDVILCAHMDEKMEGDILKERFDIVGGSKAEIYKSSDAIGKLYMEGKHRKLDFSPREGSLGKNPAQLDILTVPNFAVVPDYFATVLRDIKASLNKMGEAQQAGAQEIEGWRTLIIACQTAADFNAILPKAKGASQVVKMLLMAESKAKGIQFDKEGMQFYEKSPESPSEAPKPPEGTQPPPEPQKAQEQAPAPKEKPSKKAEEPLHVELVTVTDAELRQKKVGKGTQPFWLLSCDIGAGDDFSLAVHVWHKSLFEYVSTSVGKVCEFGMKRNIVDAGTPKETVFYSLEQINKIGDQVFENNVPSTAVLTAGQLGFE